MTVSYHYNKAKVLQALRYHFINKKDIRILLIAVNVLALLSGILFAIGLVKQPGVFVLTSVMWMVLMLVFWLLMPRLIYSRTKAFQDNFVARVTDTEITLQQEHGTRTWAFNQFTAWFESPHFFHLYLGANSFFILPKEAFSPEQTIEFRNLCNTYITR